MWESSFLYFVRIVAKQLTGTNQFCVLSSSRIFVNTTSFQITALLFSALLHSCGSRTASTFTPSQPVCPGERVQFNCTVVDDGQPIHGYTFWNISTVRRICVLAHFLRSDQDRCGLFTAQLYFEGVRRFLEWLFMEFSYATV